MTAAAKADTGGKLLAERLLANLRPLGVGQPSVTLLQPLGKSVLYIRTEHALPDGMLETVKAQIAKAAGPGVRVLALADKQQIPDGTIVVQRGLYRLALVPARFGTHPIVSTAKEALRGSAFEQAHVASKVFKQGQTPTVPYKILKFYEGQPRRKSGPWERIVTGVILEPEVVDGTKTEETEGDIYSEEEITKAMYYWMENNFGAFSHHHIDQGGKPLTSGRDIVLLENWQQYPERRLGDQLIKAGAWMQSNRIGATPRGEYLWKEVLAGHINSWSIGANAMGAVEEVAGSVQEAGR